MNEEIMNEEELLRFIAEVEENAMVEAPFYLKESIVSQAKTWQQKKARRQYRAFQVKVWLAAAAAIMVILLIPSEIKMVVPARKAVPVTKEEYMERQNRTFSSSVDRFVNKMIGQISLKEDKKI